MLSYHCQYTALQQDFFANVPKDLLNLEAVAQMCSIKKETLAQVFSCEFCEISKNTFSYRTPLVAASVNFRDELEFLDGSYSRKFLH